VIVIKSTPFNPDTDLAPVPFSLELCEIAEQLKQNGLSWHPHIGCFVWDKDKHIEVTSPFPNRIYFILNLGHFLKIFQTTEKIKENLIWLPTWHQARQICEQLHISPDKLKKQLFSENHLKDDLVGLYKIILKELKKNISRRSVTNISTSRKFGTT